MALLISCSTHFRSSHPSRSWSVHMNSHRQTHRDARSVRLATTLEDLTFVTVSKHTQNALRHYSDLTIPPITCTSNASLSYSSHSGVEVGSHRLSAASLTPSH